MDTFRESEKQHLLLLISSIYIMCILVFWPLVTVCIWSAALAIALMPLHIHLSRIVKPSISAAFITLWVLLITLLVLSVSANILFSNIGHIGTMVASLVKWASIMTLQARCGNNTPVGLC